MRWGIAVAVLCVACGETGEAPPRSRTAASAPEPAAAPEDDTPVASVDDYMSRHFHLVAKARDCVIRGDLPCARAAFEKLGEGDYGMEVPQEWMRSLYDMQAEARRGAVADEIAEAGRAVGAVSRQCGECHQTHRRTPEAITTDAPYRPGPDRSLADAMARHAWASEHLWLGITVPRPSAWARGVEALMVPVPEGIEPAMASRLQALRDAAPGMEGAHTLAAQAKAYGKLITQCASCHASTHH